MSYTYTKQLNDTSRLVAWECEQFVKGIIDAVAEGHTLCEGSAVKTASGYSVLFCTGDKVVEPVKVDKDEPIKTPVEPVKVVGALSMSIDTADKISQEVVDVELIKGFLQDKDKLEKYGLTFGIDLKKNKSFKNMLIDLKEHLEK